MARRQRMIRLVAAVIGVLIGSIPTADGLARLRGIDLRISGSGNPGTANAVRVGGARLGAAVLALDVVKGVLAVMAGRALGGDIAGLMAGGGAIAGQVVNPWYRGRGGKGLGVTGGVTAAAWPFGLALVLPVMGVAAAMLGSTRGALVGLAGYAASAIWWAAADMPSWWGVRDDAPLVVFAVLLAIGLSVKFITGLRSARPAPRG